MAEQGVPEIGNRLSHGTIYKPQLPWDDRGSGNIFQD
jgi:hypothetical protein